MHRPFFVSGCVMLAALLLCLFLPAAVWAAGGLLFGCALLFAAVKRTALCKALLCACLAFSAAVLSFHVYRDVLIAPLRPLEGRRHTVTGEIAELPQTKEARTVLVLCGARVDGERVPGKVQVTCSALPAAQVGKTAVVARCLIAQSDETDLFYYHSRAAGICLRGFGGSAAIEAAPEGFGGLRFFRRARAGVLERLNTLLPEETATVTGALLTGSADRLPEELTAALRVCGGSHLFAVSGLHLNFWTGALFLLPGRRLHRKKSANLAALVFTAFYCAFTGFSPSVLRAGVMSAVVFAGRILRRAPDSLNSLGLAMTLLLAANPFLAGNVSFLYSAAAAAAIAGVFARIETVPARRSGWIPRGLSSAWKTLLLGGCVLLFTVPISALFFGTFSLLAPVTGLMCAVPLPAVMLTGFAALLAGASPPGAAFAWLNRQCAALLTWLIRLLGSAHGALYPAKLAPLAVWYLATAGVLALLIVLRKKKWVLPALSGSVCLLLCVQLVVQSVGLQRLQVRLYSIGNALSVSVVDGAGCTAALIGTGETYAQTAVVANDLSRRTAHVLNALVLPCPSAAEYAGWEQVLRSCEVRQLPAAAGIELPETTAAQVLTADCFTIEPLPELRYENICTPEINAGLLTVKGVRILLVFTPDSDLGRLTEEQRRAEILLCRGDLPKGAVVSDYREVVVATEKTAAELRLPTGAVTTAETGERTWTFRQPICRT